jgi:hypothetical protein
MWLLASSMELKMPDPDDPPPDRSAKKNPPHKANYRRFTVGGS